MKREEIVVGIIGLVMGRHHLESALKCGVNVGAICDIDEAQLKKIGDEFGVPEEKRFTDYHDLLNNPEINVVLLVVPDQLHLTMTEEFLAAGKHVLCEKPITINYALSCEMAEEAKKQGKILNIGVCNRYHKSVELLAEMNREGKFGNIYHVYCSFRCFRNIPGLGGAFTDKAQSGGGVLIDWGIHFLDLILYILGDVKLKNVTADAYSEMAKDMKSYKYRGTMWAEDTADVENGTNDVDDYVTGYIRTSGASISFNGAWAQNIDKDEMFIDFLGDKAGARLTYGGKFEVYRGDTLETVKPEYDIPDMRTREDEDFFRSIDSGIKNKNNIDNILETMKLLDALYASAEKKGEIVF